MPISPSLAHILHSRAGLLFTYIPGKTSQHIQSPLKSAIFNHSSSTHSTPQHSLIQLYSSLFSSLAAVSVYISQYFVYSCQSFPSTQPTHLSLHQWLFSGWALGWVVVLVLALVIAVVSVREWVHVWHGVSESCIMCEWGCWEAHILLLYPRAVAGKSL